MKVKIIEAETSTRREKLRVAAYARVSNEDDGPARSMQAQIDHYTDLICTNSEWSFAGIYCDKYVTGTLADKRHGFQRLMKDCAEKKIDVILCKSISRFSRNTVDLLNSCRFLKHLGIDVRFEKERINTVSEDGELMLTLVAAFAEEESRSISENVKWGIRKGFECGHSTKYKLYGYLYDGKEYKIMLEQALIVRRIFEAYLAGKTAEQLEKAFAAEGILGPKGGAFKAGTIRRMLTNITYTGNTVLQREYIWDHITHKRRKNNGELAKYIVWGSHPVIIPQALYDAVQEEMDRRRRLGRTSEFFMQSWHTRKLYCGVCGAPLWYTSKAGTGGKRRAGAFVCSRKSRRGASVCSAQQVPEAEFKAAVRAVLNEAVFSEELFSRAVERVTAYEGQHLHFLLTDGNEVDIKWKARNRYA